MKRSGTQTKKILEFTTNKPSTHTKKMPHLGRTLDSMKGMPGMNGELPPGVFHSIECTDHRELSYENAWMVPFLILLTVLIPWGWLNRMDGIRENNHDKKIKGYCILAVCFFIGLILLVFENGVNHSPESQIPYSNKIVFVCFITIVPFYLLLRDSGVLCPTGANSCCCCGQRGNPTLELICHSQGEFWEYGMMALSSVGVTMSGFWSTLGCHDVQIELGHWVPFLGFMSYAGVLLYFSGPRRRHSINLQYVEGWMWISWGIVFNIYFIPGSGGGLFYRFFHHGEISPLWGLNQQHIFQAVFYIFTGGLGIGLAKVEIKTGFHILMLGIGMFSMLSLHPQYCLLERDMHVAAGQIFLIVGLLRFFNRIIEASLMMTVLSGTFACSTACTVTWGDVMFEGISFITFIVMLWGSWWLYVAYMFQDHWNIPAEAVTVVSDDDIPIVVKNSDGEKQYIAINPVEQEAENRIHVYPHDHFINGNE